MSATRKLLLVVVCLTAVTVCSPYARADMLGVEITPPGYQQFSETNTVSGQVTWFAEQDLTIPNSPYDVLVTFTVAFAFTDSDNVPVDPQVSELLLTNWPEGYPASPIWDFTRLSSTIDGPLDIWVWSAQVTLEPQDVRPTFQAGQTVATATWQTLGDDVDNLSDDNSFSLVAAMNVTLTDSGDWLTIWSPQHTKTLNPEAIPEPTTLMLFTLGAITMQRLDSRREIG